MTGFCRDCGCDIGEGTRRCGACGSPRVVQHPELARLAVAHVDCDAFYATVEKRDDPSLADKPVIVGGRQRGVVLTACYVARTFGVRSAMPMFEARRLCPHATVVRPDMDKYARVGKVAQARLAADGYRTVGDLQRASEADLVRRYGGEGARLARLARGLDDRPVRAEREAKSISAETTFEHDTGELRALELRLWRLCERVSARLKAGGLAGSTVTLKLKSANFRLRTRAQSFDRPTQLAAKIFACGRELLAREIDGTQFRLIGIGVSGLAPATGGDLADLIDRRAAQAELAVDRLRERFGDEVVVKGLVFEQEDEE